MRLLKIITSEGEYEAVDPPDEVLKCAHCDWINNCQPNGCIFSRLDNWGQVLRKLNP